ncbi:2-keto-4-pentenoate hydratase/2-oxohepta-3-ene-1,7-dioic acid hydratase (catechol pathway) [Seinonella peptonophila]|uniref:2-keto-4-pentenoate hydratase/2-oxohepta-3-ene-1,7-dioic acid hydratase (Catechol pathway) n=1 Tax=Seinonella peptonophila TaxID=112248 RepID=A0A1M4VQJ5_9BACL|nr:fumarylacetoacetate hydrolase family protein [Seinonella peptonophila]SHE71103.1 2-keto-4-pentenoate hydratase/2-oxohepta-3-ene-1,7-dioic acid hydratase (catechol pathway) [Seinonella peptonophila]
MISVQNIYCVGRNYQLHAAELGNRIPSKPIIFSKPTHALVEAKGQSLIVPSGEDELHHELEFVIHIKQPYQPGRIVTELVNQFALGLDLTNRDEQTRLKQKGHPWLLAKGFRNSAIITKLRSFEGIEASQAHDFMLIKNGNIVQRGNLNELIFDLQTLIDYIGTHFGLGKDDLIYTGTPSGVGTIHSGDHLQMKWGDEILGECIIEIE